LVPGLGRGPDSLAEINNILQLLNRDFAADFREPFPGQARLPLLEQQAVLNATVATRQAEELAAYGTTSPPLYLLQFGDALGANSKAVLAAATDAELRRDLTEGGDMYIDRHGRFYINGVATDAMDLAVTSRLLAQDNIGAEYKVIMDEYAERNNLIDAANKTLESVTSNEALSYVDRGVALKATIENLNMQYGEDDMLAVLTAGKITLDKLKPAELELITSTEVYLDRLDTRITAMKDFYADARADAEIRRARYLGQGLTSDNFSSFVDNNTFVLKSDLVSRVDVVIEDIDRVLEQLDEGLRVVRSLNDGLLQSIDSFKEELEVQKARVGTDNVFQWLRNFDVDPDYLWQGDWETLDNLKFVTGKTTTDMAQGQIDPIRWYFTYKDINGSVIPIYDEDDNATIGGDPRFPFDWTQSNWGWFTGGIAIDNRGTRSYGPDSFFNDAAIKELFASFGLNPPPANLPPYWYSGKSNLSVEWGSQVWNGFLLDQYNPDGAYKIPAREHLQNQITLRAFIYEGGGGEQLDQSVWGFFDLTHWQTGGATLASKAVTLQPNQGASTDFSDEMFFDLTVITPDQFDEIEALLNTLISNKVRDGELDQAKLQTLTAQLQNNTEAMTAMIKVFSTLYNALAQSLR
jgi:hypothetical protein